ncbi:MAG: hypothetical protein N3A59_03610 [Thermodesulfovibrionales bacterium]|nr:hypothetical protein [Thermodesulfovibrionales bacterium]
MKKKKIFILIVSFLFFVTVALYAVQSPFLINKLTYLIKDNIGYEIKISNISLSPILKGEITDLYISGLDKEGLIFSASNIEVEGRINYPLQGEIKRASLKEPKLSLLIGKGGKTELSFLYKLPPIELLEIKKGEAKFLLSSSGIFIILSNINLNIQNFSPIKGGRFLVKSQIIIESKDHGFISEQGNLEADFNFTAIQPTPIGKGNIKLTLNNLRLKNFEFINTMVYLALEINKEQVTLNNLSIITSDLIYRGKNKNIELKNFKLKPYGIFYINKGELYAGVKQSEISSLGSIDIDIYSTLTKNLPWNASIKLRSVNIDKVAEIIKHFLPSQYKNWLFQGYGDLEIKMTGDFIDNNITAKGQLRLQFKNGGFSSPDGNKAVQGAAGTIILNILIPTQDKKGHIELMTQIYLGELLWGKYYKDFSKIRFSLTAQGFIYDKSPKSGNFSGIIDLEDAGKYYFTISSNNPKWNVNLKSDYINLEDFTTLFIKDFLIQESPSLSELELKGLSTLEVNFETLKESFSLKGNLMLKEGYINIPNSFSLNIDLKLPFDFNHPSKNNQITKDEEIKRGYITFKKIKLTSFEIPTFNIPVLSSKSSFWIQEKITIPFLDSTLSILNLRADNLFTSEATLKIGLTASDLDLGLVIENTIGVKVPAKLSAHFNEAVLKGDDLKVNGSAVVDIFSGKVNIYNIHCRKLFSNSRKFGSDITFENINLKELTDFIEVGKMSGIIKGYLKDFEIEYGQPSHFILSIDSVKTEGIPQNISVEAIENISIIGSGSKGIGTTLRRGLSQFFKHYSYSKIGILCTLEKDIFALRGKILEGGKEYLIRKTLFGGIDVINQIPQNNISFKDMKERINRVFRKKQES